MKRNTMSFKAIINNIAKENKVSAQSVLQTYMLERLLERISVSKYKDNFILKGGMLITAMLGIDSRTTMDMDTTIKGFSLTEENIKNIMNEICKIDLTDRTPIKFDMTFPSNVRIDNEYIIAHYIKSEKHLLGATKMKLEDDTVIQIYDLERTICDIIRDRNKMDPQIFNTAMKEYSKRKNKNLNLLYKYAKAFRIENKLKQYMEVLD